MENNKTQTVLTAAILIVLIGILVALVIVFVKLNPTLVELEATMKNVHTITDKLVELLPNFEKLATDTKLFAADKISEILNSESGKEVSEGISNLKNLVGNINKLLNK